MAKIRVAFNGMGRIGKNVMRVIVEKFNDKIEIVAGNDLVPAKEIAQGLPKDSIFGRFPVEVSLVSDNVIKVGDHTITVYAEKDANNIKWAAHNVDVVFECTGFYLTTEKAQAHINAGAKRVIVSAPCNDATKTVVLGVNHTDINADDRIISNASCTTNCLAPMTKALDDTYKVISGLISTTHAATATQKVADAFGGGKNRATLNNIIPASTGAAKAVTKVIPSLLGKLTGMAFRVPTADVSVVDLTVKLSKETSYDQVKAAFKSASEGSLKGVLGYTEDLVVSQDFIGDPRTSIVDAHAGIQLNSTFFKVISWYDNEAGYSNKLIDLSLHVSSL